MKQKLKTRILQTIKLSFLVSFLFVEFFGLGTLPAQALGNPCNLEVNFDIPSKTVELGNPVFFTARVTFKPGSLFCLSTYENIYFVVFDGNKPDRVLYACTLKVSQPQKEEAFQVDTQCADSPKVNVISPPYKNGDVLKLYAGAWTTQLGFNYYPGRSFDTLSTPIDVSVGTAGQPPGNAPTLCTGGPNAKGTCPTDGQICSAATAGTCSSPPPPGQSGNSATTLYNPIPGFDNLTSLLVNIMKGFLEIIAVWAVAFIVIGGFKMVISQGNEESVLAAKKTITWAVLGLLVAVLSFVIIAIVQNLVGIKVSAPTASIIITETGLMVNKLG